MHVPDANGQQVGGQDSAPVNNQYPPSQWRENVTIVDPHTLTFGQSLASGEYKVEIGLYTLLEGARLTFTPASEHVKVNGVTISQFTGEKWGPKYKQIENKGCRLREGESDESHPDSHSECRTYRRA